MVDADQLVGALTTALETGRGELQALLAPGAVIWYNLGGNEVDARANHARASASMELLQGRRVEVSRVAPFADGVVVQYTIHGTLVSSGADFEMRNCTVMICNDEGQVTRLEEYVDSTGLRLLTKCSGP